MFENPTKAIETPEVQAMIKELSKFGLGVFVPHMHDDQGYFVPLPSDTVQLESRLEVSFVKNGDPLLKAATVVGWVWDDNSMKVAAVCACSGSHFPGNCSSTD